MASKTSEGSYCYFAKSVVPWPVKTLTLKLPDALFAEIANDAKARNVSKSQVVRERLAHSRAGANQGSLWSRMEDLVIEADLLPADLSSNKAHLKRYGKNRSDR